MFSTSAILRERFQKTVLIVLFLLLTIALIITWNTPAAGYEASIYGSTPLIFWVSVVFSVIAGITLIIQSKPDLTSDRAYIWKTGLLLVLLGYTVILGLFIIRGYYMWCLVGDPASHIGWIKDTLVTGHFPSSIIYPITHIYLSETILVTGLDLVFLHKIVPLGFALLCVVFMYLLVRTLSSNRLAPILAVVVSCTLTYGWYLNFTPNALSNLFFPLALFLMFQFLRQKTISWGILFIIIIVLYPVFHPVPAIFIVLVFLTLWIPDILPGFWRTIREKRIGLLNVIRPDFTLLIPLLLLVIWSVFWFSSFSVWDFSIKGTIQTLSSEGGSSQITGLANQVSYAQGYGYNVVEQILKRMGGSMILGILSVLAFLSVWKKVSENREEKDLFSLYGPFGLLCIFIPVLYMFNPVVDPLRMVVYASMLGTVFAAYFLSVILQRNNHEKNPIKSRSVAIVTIVVLTSLFFLGCLNLYPSPYNLTPNYQTTQSEVLGMNFFYQYRDVNIPVSGISASPGRIAAAFLTPEERKIQLLPMYFILGQGLAPWHFGYDRFSSVSATYLKKTNLLITQRDKVTYTEYFPEMAQYRFSILDFKRLTEDPSMNLLYTNGGFDFWEIACERSG